MDGKYILPRAKLSNTTTMNRVSVIDIEDDGVKRSAEEIVQQARKVFNSGKTKSYSFREKQLKNIFRFLKEEEQAICKALYDDVGKPEQEALILEVEITMNDAKIMLKHLKKWMAPESPKRPLVSIISNDTLRIYNDPYGVVLVMGAWNYPLQLTLGPVIGAIAAGNCVIIKPSDLSPNISKLLYEKLPQYIDKDCYPVYLGGIPETTELLQQRFDYIFFTGSPQVGRIVHAAATKHLTPTTLELGGKCPVFIDNTADIELATKRILWGKFINCGQTCIAPDYILCNKEVQGKFLQHAHKQLKEFYGEKPRETQDYARIINERHFLRLGNIIKNQKIALGGQMDANALYIHPTILVDVAPDDDVMQEEIFGPILPILNVEDAASAIEFINNREKPLALYVFTKSGRTREMFLENTSSGGVCVNDTLMHITVETLPFGGVGNSGMGSYHGKKSFDTFVHKKSVLVRNFCGIVEKFQEMRYAPYNSKKTWMMRMGMGVGNTMVYCGFLWYLLVFLLGVAAALVGVFLCKE